MAASLLSFLQDLPEGPVTIYLNTEGGAVSQAQEIVAMVRALGSRATVHAFGACMSAGTLILCAAYRRIATPTCEFLIHYGEETNLSPAESKTSRRLYKWSLALYRETLRISPQTLGRYMHKDTYITPKHAMKIGLIHQIKDLI